MQSSRAATSRKPSGEIYRNTDDDWNWLTDTAGKAARWLGYVPFERITDNRNAEPTIHRKARVTAEAFVSIGIDVAIPDADDLEPLPMANGFEARQPFRFAMYGEKARIGSSRRLHPSSHCRSRNFLGGVQHQRGNVFQAAKAGTRPARVEMRDAHVSHIRLWRSLKPADVAPDDVARCLCFRPDKENCKCQRTKRKSIR